MRLAAQGVDYFDSRFNPKPFPLRGESHALERLLDARLEFVAKPELAREQIEIELIDRLWSDS